MNTPKATNGLSDLQQSIVVFLNEKRAENVTLSTVRFYQIRLGEFEKWCQQIDVSRVLDITPDVIRSFILYLQDKGHNSGGVHAYYRTIKTFMYFYENEYEPEDWKNPIRKVKAPKLVVELIEGVSVENVELLLDACDTTTPLGLRNKTIILLLLETGVRAKELLNINVEDIDYTDSSIQIRQGKGRKPRTVFMGSTARKTLRRYLRNMPDNGAVFTTQEGDRLTYNGLREIIRRLSKKAGIDEPGIHDFRRTFALEQLRRGVDLYTISRLMGHSDLQVLSRYLKQTKGDLGRSYRSIVDS